MFLGLCILEDDDGIVENRLKDEIQDFKKVVYVVKVEDDIVETVHDDVRPCQRSIQMYLIRKLYTINSFDFK